VGPGVLAPPVPPVGGQAWSDVAPLARIADAVGTPVYVYGADPIRRQYAALDAALAGLPHRIHYSVKANGSVALLRLLRELGAGVDVVSGGELYLARRAGFGGDDIVFGGVGKTAREIGEALDVGVQLINAESEDEVMLINELAAARGAVARVGLRVNPEVTVDTPHAYTRTGERGSKFGVPVYEAVAVAGRLLGRGLANVRLAGLDMHIGSQIAGVEPYERALARLLDVVRELRADGAGKGLEFLDIGGGLAVSYGGGDGIDVSSFSRTVTSAVGPTGLTLLLEPGRFLVGNAGLLLTRVLYRKQSGGKTYVVTDAGMTELLRPSHYQAYHRIDVIAATRRPQETPRTTVDVVGPVCESGDFFALDRELDRADPGDLLAIHSAGAYGFAMASNYNARVRPPEVLVDGDRYAVVRVRETYDDLVRHEVDPPLDWVTH
jgi:diaminopimelate decarboxylase